MKTLSCVAALKDLLTAFAAGTLLLLGLLSVSADDVTNAPIPPPKHGLHLQFNVGPERPEATNYHGLPKEAFDRLSPEQIVELAKADEPPPAMIITIVVTMFAMIVACVALGVSQRLKRAKLLHETLRLMIEKGQPIPAELLKLPDSPRRPRNDLRNGLVLISVGLGLGVMLLTQGDNDWPLALIPLLMGVAFLVARQIEKNSSGQPK